MLRTLKELSNWISRCAWDGCLNPNGLSIDNPKTLSVMLVPSLDWLSTHLVLRLRLSLVIVQNMTNSHSFVIYSLETGKWKTLGILVGWFQYDHGYVRSMHLLFMIRCGMSSEWHEDSDLKRLRKQIICARRKTFVDMCLKGRTYAVRNKSLVPNEPIKEWSMCHVILGPSYLVYYTCP